MGIEARPRFNLCVPGSLRSHRRHEPVEHALLAGLVEVDRKLVALDRGDVAVAEFLVKHPVADLERRFRRRHRLGDQFTLDCATLYRRAAGAIAGIDFAIADALDRMARARAPVAVGRLVAVLLGALPAGRRVAVVERALAGVVEARGAIRIASADLAAIAGAVTA